MIIAGTSSSFVVMGYDSALIGSPFLKYKLVRICEIALAWDFGVAGTLEGKNIIELQANDLLSNTPITRNSSKKITINIGANIPSNYELVYLHCWLRNANDYEIENIIVNRYRLDYTGSILYYAAYVLANMSNNSEKECFSSTSFDNYITANRSSIVIDLTDLGGRLSADFPSSPLEPFVFTAFYYPVSG